MGVFNTSLTSINKGVESSLIAPDTDIYKYISKNLQTVSPFKVDFQQGELTISSKGGNFKVDNPSILNRLLPSLTKIVIPSLYMFVSISGEEEDLIGGEDRWSSIESNSIILTGVGLVKNFTFSCKQQFSVSNTHKFQNVKIRNTQSMYIYGVLPFFDNCTSDRYLDIDISMSKHQLYDRQRKLFDFFNEIEEYFFDHKTEKYPQHQWIEYPNAKNHNIDQYFNWGGLKIKSIHFKFRNFCVKLINVDLFEPRESRELITYRNYWSVNVMLTK